MKYMSFFILATLMGWNSWGLKFPCEGGQQELEEQKRKVQNYQNYDQEYKSSTHLLLAYCQMALGDPRGALQNFQTASDMGTIQANYLLADYYLTGGWGQDKAAKNLETALWEFEKTLQKINAVFADYPNTDLMAGDEITTRIYPNTLLALIQQGTNKYLAEGYKFYDVTSPTYYDDPAKAIQRHQANKLILDRVEYHIESCLADHEGQNMMFRARRFTNSIPNFENKLAKYNAFYFKVKEGYCPLFKEALTEIRKREEKMFAIALNCTLPDGTPTEDRPPCSHIKIQTKEFATFFIEEWLPKKDGIASG